MHFNFGSWKSVAARDIAVYLPPDYFSDPRARFPVLYMQDGQNMFDPAASFGGMAWAADETAQNLIIRKKIEPLIIVGIYNTGDRMDEYAPVRARIRGGEHGGRADEFGHWLTDEVKPFIDATYRTRPEREFTGVGGSSMGGLFALHMGLTRFDTFGRVAAMSPSAWWARGQILREAAALRERVPVRIWLDMGTREGRRYLEQTRMLQEILRSKGWKKNRKAALADFRYFEAAKAGHDEHSWGSRFDKVLKFLYPKI